MSRAWRGLAFATILAVLVVALTPWLWIFLTSFKSRLDALAAVPVWAFEPTFEHYPAVFLGKAAAVVVQLLALALNRRSEGGDRVLYDASLRRKGDVRWHRRRLDSALVAAVQQGEESATA